MSAVALLALTAAVIGLIMARVIQTIIIMTVRSEREREFRRQREAKR